MFRELAERRGESVSDVCAHPTHVTLNTGSKIFDNWVEAYCVSCVDVFVENRKTSIECQN